MKKLIPAIALLLVSAVLMGTSTFAWFSMNRTVTATGMQVTAKSDSVFLLIGTDDTAAAIQTAGTITTALTVDSAAAQVYPSAHDAVTNTADATATNVSNVYRYHLTSDDTQTITLEQYAALSSGDKALYTADNRNGTNWYYKIADAVDASTSTKGANYLTTVDATYVIHKTCYVTLAAGSNDASNLKVTGMAIASNSTATGGSATITPVKVLVTTATAAVELDSTTTSSDTVLAATVTSSAVVQIDIFIYYNGNDAAVYTNNVANLDGATIDLTFGVD